MKQISACMLIRNVLCSVQVKEVQDYPKAYTTIMGLVVKLAEHGLIHCDFNEFNLLVSASPSTADIDSIDLPFIG